MKCKCEEEMKYVWCWDDDEEGYCFNIYVCDCCGFVFKDDACGRIFIGIDIDNVIWRYNKTKKEWKRIDDKT